MAGQKPRSYDELATMHSDAVAFDGKEDIAPMYLRPNTFAHFIDSDVPAFDVTFYEARIARLYNDSVTIWSGGVRTATTKNRINDFLLPIKHELVQINHNWYVRDMTTYRTRDFVDGMNIEKPKD